jgi:hypothetical protein
MKKTPSKTPIIIHILRRQKSTMLTRLLLQLLFGKSADLDGTIGMPSTDAEETSRNHRQHLSEMISLFDPATFAVGFHVGYQGGRRFEVAQTLEAAVVGALVYARGEMSL